MSFLSWRKRKKLGDGDTDAGFYECMSRWGDSEAHAWPKEKRDRVEHERARNMWERQYDEMKKGQNQ